MVTCFYEHYAHSAEMRQSRESSILTFRCTYESIKYAPLSDDSCNPICSRLIYASRSPGHHQLPRKQTQGESGRRRGEQVNWPVPGRIHPLFSMQQIRSMESLLLAWPSSHSVSVGIGRVFFPSTICVSVGKSEAARLTFSLSFCWRGFSLSLSKKNDAAWLRWLLKLFKSSLLICYCSSVCERMYVWRRKLLPPDRCFDIPFIRMIFHGMLRLGVAVSF